MNANKARENFLKNGYAFSYFGDAGSAADYLYHDIVGTTVGFGDSATLNTLNLFKRLSERNQVTDPQHCPEGKNFTQTAKECLTSNIFVTSANAATENGELVNIDGTGNRAASALFGHEKVYFVLGSNKFVPQLEDAIWRARNIAAPLNAHRLGIKTPCAKHGDRCYNCASPERICNGMVLHLKKMHDIEMEIICIDEKLGY